MWQFKPRIHKIREYLENLGDGDPEDIGLNELEKKHILPRYQAAMVALELCHPQGEELQRCLQENHPLVCSYLKLRFIQCTRGHDRINAYMDRYTDNYIDIRSKYRSTKDEKYLNDLKSKILPSDKHYHGYIH